MFEEQLPRLEGLFALSRAQGLDVRPTLLRVLTDLFVGSRYHSETDMARFGELALHLIDQVDEETRIVVAGKLGPCPFAPRNVLDKLIGSEPEAAVCIIEASPLLTQEDLWTLAVDGGPMTCAAIARRSDLGSDLTRFLARKGYPLVADALSDNSDAPLDREVVASLAPFATEVPELAERLASRPGLEQSWLAPLFPFLPATARENVIEAFQREGSRRRPLTRETQITAPHLALAFLETAALSRSSDDLASGLARVIGIPEAEALRIVREPSGETLAVTLIAVGMPADQAARVLMFAVAGLGESVDGLRRLMRIVETLPRVAATRVVRAFAPSRHTTTPPRHAGLFSPSAPARPQGLAQRREGREGHAVASDHRQGGTSEEV